MEMEDQEKSGTLTDSSRDGNPFKFVDELEGQGKNVEPSDLRNQNGVRQWKWSVKHTLVAGHNFFQRVETSTSLRVMHRHGNRTVNQRLVDISGQVVENLGWQVSERFIGALDLLAWVGHGHWNTQVLAKSFHHAWLLP